MASHAIIKLDFKNAFNTIRRDAVLEASKIAIPEDYPFIYSRYTSPSTLRLGSDIMIQSEEGVQQEDPLGPALFCLAMHPLFVHCSTELKVGYLDDVTLGGEVKQLADELVKFRAGAEKLGLTEWEQMWNNHTINNRLICRIFKLVAHGHWEGDSSRISVIAIQRYRCRSKVSARRSQTGSVKTSTAAQAWRLGYSAPFVQLVLTPPYSTKLILWRQCTTCRVWRGAQMWSGWST